MKTKTQFYLWGVLFFFIPFFADAQAQWNTTGGNSVTTTNTYLGTDGSSTSPLQIKTTETGTSALPINFYTNNTQRVTIDANGNVGIGPPMTPNSVLHLYRSSSAQVATRYANNVTNSSLYHGFLVGIDQYGIGMINHLGFFPVQVSTGGALRATFTSDDGSGNFTFGTALPAPSTEGEGLRIHDPNNTNGDLDLWTSTAGQSHINGDRMAQFRVCMIGLK